MTMVVDFIPPRHRQLRRVRARGRRWAAACVLVGAGLVLAYAVLMVNGGTAADGVGEELARVRAKLELETADRAACEARIVRAESELALVRAIGRHPDWSLLLRVLARERGERVVLERLQLKRTDKPAEKPADTAVPGGPGPVPATPASEQYGVRLAGQALSQGDATQFTLRLENLGFFDSVRLVETRPVNVQGREYVAFQVECSVGSRRAAAQAGVDAEKGGAK